MKITKTHSFMMNTPTQFLCISIIILFLASCGQKGPLYFPDTPPQTTIKKA